MPIGKGEWMEDNVKTACLERDMELHYYFYFYCVVFCDRPVLPVNSSLESPSRLQDSDCSTFPHYV
jgi:hypothetical protein